MNNSIVTLPSSSQASINTKTPPPSSTMVSLKTFTIAKRDVKTAFWSADGQVIYFGTQTLSEDSLKWFTCDVATQLTKTVAAPQHYDPRVQQRLFVPDIKGYDGYPSVLGYVSPSGKNHLFTLTYGSPSPSNPNGRTEIWLTDSGGQHNLKLMERPIGSISQATWFKNEMKVIFDFGYEGGVKLYIANTQDGTIISLADMSDFEGATDQIWSVSPDGTTLAIIDSGYRLWLISLEDGRSRIIDQSTRYPHWSNDGKFLYYWWGASFSEAATLRVYDDRDRTMSNLIERSSLTSAFNVPPLGFGDYEVSPQRDKVVFWGGRLWLVELHK